MIFVRQIVISALCALLVFLAVGYTACNSDICRNIFCKNGGSCVAGGCRCTSGYEGNLCEAMINVKFAGVYNAQESCTMSGGNSFAVRITADTANPFHVVVNNLGNFLNCTTALNATVISDSIRIDDTGCSYHFIGNGVLSDSLLNLNYLKINGSDTESCTAVLKKS